MFSFSSLIGSSSSREKTKQPSVSASSTIPSPPVTKSSAFRSSSRNGHMPFGTHWNVQPSVLGVAHETPPELQPILSFLSNHSKKLYTEGYFLKLTDLNPGMLIEALCVPLMLQN